jgi:Uma2 family endonuclease
MASNPVVKLTEDEYLAIERAGEFKSEFIGGEMFAMSGGSPRHSKLQWNLVMELGGAIRGKGCTGFGSDMRVRVSAAMYTYPDISVVCGTPRYADGESESLLNPTVIVEVLSPSTEKYDRGLKFQHYRTIESLNDYLLVDQDQIRIEQYTRQADGTWMFRDYQKQEDELSVESIEVSIPLARIYENVL